MTERQAMPLRLGVVANIQVGPEAEATAALVLHELGRRLGAIELTAITLTEPQRPTTRSSWSAPNAAGQADFYIHSVSDEALDHWGIAAERRLRTTLFDSDFPLTAAYATTVDPFAAEARRLMLDHIGVSATHSLSGALAHAGQRTRHCRGVLWCECACSRAVWRVASRVGRAR